MTLLTSLVLSLLFATRPTVKLRTPQESMARTMLMNFTAGRFEAATKDFNATLQKLVTPQMLADLKKQFDADAGAFQFVSNVREGKDAEQFRFAELSARYEKTTVLVNVLFDQTNKIGNVTFNRVVVEKVDPALEATARELLANFIAARFAEVGKDFNATLGSQLTPERIEALRHEIAETYGAYRGVIGARQRTEKDYRVLELTVVFERKASFVVVFDSAGKVSGLRFAPWK
ncbi:MAG TPA: DUF3887 domain-containing protein [Thermoanaerobaculia bacterium]|nr:DUF3887 domain-containing protein [Thermoanaerobaculia bacterium]